MHGLAVVVDGDLPIDGREPGADAAIVTVRVQRRPAWADDALDPRRTLFAAPTHDEDANLIDVGWTVSGHGMRMRYAEGATFWVAAALDEIWLTYEAPLSSHDAAHFLLEPVLAFVLRCRGTLVLHASAVELNGRAVLFVGPAGSGKSTTAGACVAAGGALLSDDVVALDHADGRWAAQPGTTAIRVWDEGAAALVGAADLAPRFSDTWEKRVVSPVRIGGRVADGAVPVGLICVLGERTSDATTPLLGTLGGQAAMRELLPNTSANYLHDAKRRAEELAQLAALIARVPVVRLRARSDTARLGDIAAVIASRLVA